MLDEFAGLASAREQVGGAFREWKRLQSEFDAFQMDEREKAARLDLLKFQVGELDKRQPASRRRRGARNHEARAEQRRQAAAAVGEAYAALYDSDEAALARLGTVWKRVAELAEVDPTFQPHLEARDAIKSQLEDLARRLRAYGERIDASPARLQEVEDRLALIERLKRKYGPALADVIAKRDALSRQLDALQNADERRAELEAETLAAREDVPDAARERCRASGATPRRDSAASIQALLGELAMGRTQFDVAIRSRAAREPPGPRPASTWRSATCRRTWAKSCGRWRGSRAGGELSRVMLAIRTLAAAAAPGQDAHLRRDRRRHRRARRRRGGEEAPRASASRFRCCASRTCRRSPRPATSHFQISKCVSRTAARRHASSG